MASKPFVLPSGVDLYVGDGSAAGSADPLFRVDDANNRVGINNQTPTGTLDIIVASSGDKGLVLRSASSQSVNLFEVLDSSNSGLLTIDASGSVYFRPWTNTTVSSVKFNAPSRNLVFTGSGTSANAISLNVLDDSTLSFEGTAGQLFAVADGLSSGTIFSVNDISGMSSIEVDASGLIKLGEYDGYVGIGTSQTFSQYSGKVEINAPSGYKTLILRPGSGSTSNILELQSSSSGAIGVIDASGRFNIGSTGTTAMLEIDPINSSTKGIVIQGATSQASNLFEINTSAGTPLYYINSAGAISGISNTLASGITLLSGIPSSTTNTLYNNGTTLYWNGQLVSTGLTTNALTFGSGLSGSTATTFNGGSAVTVNLGGTGTLSQLLFPSSISIGQNSNINGSGGGSPIAIGQQAGSGANTLSNGIYIGSGAGVGVSYNSSSAVMIGDLAGSGARGDYCVFVGGGAGYNSNRTLSYYHTYVGYNAGYNEQGNGPGNTAVGYYAGYYSSGYYNTSIGYTSYVSYGNYNTLIGNNIGGISASGSYNVYVGTYAGYLTVGSNNLEISTTVGGSLLANGAYSNKINIAGTIVGDASTDRIYIGNAGTGNLSPNSILQVQSKNTTDKVLIAQGVASQSANLIEVQDSSGNALAYFDPSGRLAQFQGSLANTAIGSGSLRNIIGLFGNNTAVGYQAGYNIAATSSGSSYNTFVGDQAGYALTSGVNNVWVGSRVSTASSNASLVRSVIVGLGEFKSNANLWNAQTVSDSVFLGNWVANNQRASMPLGTGNVYLGGMGPTYDGEIMMVGTYNTVVGIAALNPYGTTSETGNIFTSNLVLGANTQAFLQTKGSATGNILITTYGRHPMYGTYNPSYNIGIGSCVFEGGSGVGSNNIEINSNPAYQSSFVSLDTAANTVYSWKLNINKTIMGDTNSKRLVIGNATTLACLNPDATLQVQPKNATDKVLIVRGTTSQSANLLEMQDVSSNPLMSVSNSGQIGIGTSTPTGMLHIVPYSGSPRVISIYKPNVSYTGDVFRLYNASGWSQASLDYKGALTLGMEAGFLQGDGYPGCLTIRSSNSGFDYSISGDITGAGSAAITYGSVAQFYTTAATGDLRYVNPFYHSISSDYTFRNYGNGNNAFSFVNYNTSAAIVTIPTTNSRTSSVGAYFVLASQSATNKAMIIRGASSQSANLLELQNSSSGVVLSVDPSGSLSGIVGTFASGVTLVSGTPAVTTNKIYNVGGSLYFNGSAVGGGGSLSGGTASGLAFWTSTSSLGYDSSILYSSGNKRLIFTGTGVSANPMNLNILQNSTLSFESTAGQVFSIADGLQSGRIFAVTDISGMPFMEVDASGYIKLAEYDGFIGVGTSQPFANYVGKMELVYPSGAYKGIVVRPATGGTGNIFEAQSSSSGTLLVVDASGELGVNNPAPGAMVDIVSRGAAVKGLLIKAAASATANLMEIQNSAGSVLVAVTPSGAISGAMSPTILQSTSGITLTDVHNGYIVEYTGTSATGTFTLGTINIPSWNCMVVNISTGVVQIASGSNTVRSPGSLYKSRTTNSSISIYRRGTTDFVLAGDLA